MESSLFKKTAKPKTNKKETKPRTVDIPWETEFSHLTPLFSYSLVLLLYSFYQTQITNLHKQYKKELGNAVSNLGYLIQTRPGRNRK